MRKTFLTLSSALLLSACLGAGKGTETAQSNAPRLDPVNAAVVLGIIKREVGSFTAFQDSKAAQDQIPGVCKGQLAFMIETVGLGMVLLNERTNGGTLGAKVPIVGMSLGPKGGVEETAKSTIKVNMLFAPGKTPETRAAVTAPQPGSLDEALRTLRQTMLDASVTPPCMTFPAEQKNSVEGTFQVIRKADGSVALEFMLLTGDLKDVRSTDVTNTITINFKAVGSYDPVTRQVINRDGNWSLRNRDGLILKLKTDGSMEREAPLPADATKQE